MNFLAHLYLSQEHTNILIGNFMADGIVGNKFSQYPEEIQKGIFLHREIDTFTDAHELVKKSKRRLNERYRHYKGVIIDIFYDHYLAKNWQEYSAIPLNLYVQSVYQLLQDNVHLLPDRTKEMLPYMIEYNWLYNYQFTEGIQRVLNGMNNRTKQQSHMHLAVEDLLKNDTDFEEDFKLFFKELRIFSHQKLNQLLQENQTL